MNVSFIQEARKRDTDQHLLGRLPPAQIQDCILWRELQGIA